MSVPNNQYKHINPSPGCTAYTTGKTQAAIALERFHYLCASIQGKYDVVDNIRPDRNQGHLFPHKGIDFSSYEAFTLEPIVGIKLYPRDDGTTHPSDLKLYRDTFKDDWRHMEGGILHCLSDQREFYSCIVNYHSKAKTTGNEEWDALFEELKDSGFNKSKIPCMYFSQKTGCLNGRCPFLHDEAASRERRNKVLAARRKVLFAPTPKERLKYTQMKYKQQKSQKKSKRGVPSGLTVVSPAATAFNAMSLDDSDIDDDEDDDDTEDEETKVRVPRVRHFCANAECMKPWLHKHKGDAPLRRCAKCLWTYYCSSQCQRTDWARHKKECAPADEIVAKDELWSPMGSRKGTEPFNIDWGDD